MLKRTLPQGFSVRNDGGEDDKPATMKQVADMVSGALRRFTTQEVPKLLEPITGQMSQVGENLTKLQESLNKLTPPPIDDKKKKDEEGPGVELNTRLQGLEKTNKDLNDRLVKMDEDRKAAEKRALDTEKSSKIRTKLAEFTFATPDAAEDAFNLVSGLIRYDKSGNLVAGDESNAVMFDAFLTEYIPAKKGHLLAASGKSGAGAQPGDKRSNTSPMSLDKIKVGMSVDEQKVAAGQILKALKSGE
jgi:hypothetical protein